MSISTDPSTASEVTFAAVILPPSTEASTLIVLNGVVFSTVTTSPVSSASAVSSAGSASGAAAAGAASPDSRSFKPLMTAVEVTVAPLTASMPSSP